MCPCVCTSVRDCALSRPLFLTCLLPLSFPPSHTRSFPLHVRAAAAASTVYHVTPDTCLGHVHRGAYRHALLHTGCVKRRVFHAMDVDFA